MVRVVASDLCSDWGLCLPDECGLWRASNVFQAGGIMELEVDHETV